MAHTKVNRGCVLHLSEPPGKEKIRAVSAKFWRTETDTTGFNSALLCKQNNTGSEISQETQKKYHVNYIPPIIILTLIFKKILSTARLSCIWGGCVAAVKNGFAPKKLFCYFNLASAKSGVGFSLLLPNRDFPSYFVMVDRLRRSIGSAVSLFGGKANLGWSASIRLASNVDGESKSNRGTTMNISWCLLGGVCHPISNVFHMPILGKGAVR